MSKHGKKALSFRIDEDENLIYATYLRYTTTLIGFIFFHLRLV